MIHPTAIIHPQAELDSSVKVGAYSIIDAQVQIGKNTVVNSHVVIKGPSTIGSNNHFYQMSSIGEAPQDLKYNNEPTQLIIGDNNIVRECCTLNRGTVGGGGKTIIGNDNLLMAYCHVAHDCIIKNQTIIANNTALAGHVIVNDFARLGGYTLVHQFCTLGSYCFTSMGAVVNKDVSPYTLVTGNYARAVGINKVGLKRLGMSEESLRALHRAFRALLYTKGPQQKALAVTAPLEAEFAEVKQFVDFIKNSERGVVRCK